MPKAFIVALLVAANGMAAPAHAQQARASRLAIDTVAEADEAIDENGNHVTGAVFDAVASVALGRGFEAVVRPFVAHLTSGEWNRQIWVATLRYERSGRVGVRVDGGLIPSPVGYANLLLRPQNNPTIALPQSLFTPLPAVETQGPRANLLGVLYPYGVNATISSRWWDARAAVIDTSPLRTRRIFAGDSQYGGFVNPPRFVNVVVGGGVTPAVGLRIGTSVTHGGWQKAGESPAITADRDATVVTVETEYSVRYTKIAGEWTHDSLQTSHGDTHASGWFVQGQQTLTPRWFASGRVERMSAPALNAAGTFDRRHYTGTEEIVGFRLTPEITLRAGHRAREGFGGTGFTHAATMSVVWWRRWL